MAYVIAGLAIQLLTIAIAAAIPRRATALLLTIALAALAFYGSRPDGSLLSSLMTGALVALAIGMLTTGIVLARSWAKRSPPLRLFRGAFRVWLVSIPVIWAWGAYSIWKSVRFSVHPISELFRYADSRNELLLWIVAPFYLGALVATISWVGLWLFAGLRNGGLLIGALRTAVVAIACSWCLGVLEANYAYSFAPQRFDDAEGICRNWERASGSRPWHVQRCMQDPTILQQAREYQEQQVITFDLAILKRLMWWFLLPPFMGAVCWLAFDILRWIARGFARTT